MKSRFGFAFLLVLVAFTFVACDKVQENVGSALAATKAKGEVLWVVSNTDGYTFGVCTDGFVKIVSVSGNPKSPTVYFDEGSTYGVCGDRAKFWVEYDQKKSRGGYEAERAEQALANFKAALQ